MNLSAPPNPGPYTVHGPAQTLWRHAGQPDPEAPMNKAGRCGLCATISQRASRIKQVISAKFTGWDTYTTDADPLWCPACAWLHTDSTLRSRPWLITPTVGHTPTRTELTTLLTAPLPADVSVTVPLSRKKHILATAQWGKVATDDRILPWDAVEASRLADLRWLRDLGFNEAALAETVPRFEQLTRIPVSLMQQVMDRWVGLNPWRADDTYLRVALLAIRPEQTKK